MDKLELPRALHNDGDRVTTTVLLLLAAAAHANNSVAQLDSLISDILRRIEVRADSASEAKSNVFDMAAMITTTASSSNSTISSADSCLDLAMDACIDEMECLVCAASGPDHCDDIDVADCESFWDLLCCTYGTSDTCLENDLLFDLVGETYDTL